MRIKDACTRQVISASRQQSVRAAAQLMQAKGVSALVVVDTAAETVIPVGILTDSDIVRAVVANRADPDELAVGDAMTPTPVFCIDEDDLRDAIQIMQAYGIQRLPVVNADGNLAGILAAADIHGALLAELQALTNAFDPG